MILMMYLTENYFGTHCLSVGESEAIMSTISLESVLESIEQIKSANVDDIVSEMRDVLSNYTLTLEQYSNARIEMVNIETETMSIITGVMPEEITSKISGVFKSFSEFMKNVWLDSVHHTTTETTMAQFKFTIEKAKEAANSVYDYYMQLA